MTNLSYSQRVEQAVDYLIIQLKIFAPKESWNLTNNGIRKAWNPLAFTWEIIIGGEVAPYAVYTNEPWIADKWKGAVNPNQGWIQRVVEEQKPILIGILSGVISQEDYTILMVTQSNVLSSVAEKAGIAIL